MTHRTEEEAAKFRLHWALYPVVSLITMFNPLAVLRGAGRLAPPIIPRLRGDILAKFDSEYSDSTIADYIYHCNVQKPTGETAFSNICHPLGWPRIGVITKTEEVPENSRITIIYGKKSWMNREIGHRMKEILSDSDKSWLNIRCINGSTNGKNVLFQIFL